MLNKQEMTQVILKEINEFIKEAEKMSPELAKYLRENIHCEDDKFWWTGDDRLTIEPIEPN